MRRVFLPGVTGLMVAHLLGYILGLVSPTVAAALFGLHPGPLLLFRVWQLLTYPFVGGAMAMVGGILVLLFLGSAIEREWKTGPFLVLWALATAGSGLMWCLVVRSPVTGGAGALFGLLIVWGHLHRHVRLAIPPIRASTLAWLVIGLFALVSLSQPPQLVWLSGAGIGWLYLWWLRRSDDRQAASYRAESPSRKGFVDID